MSPRRKQPKRPLACYECGESKRLRISGATQERRLGNADGSISKRRVVSIECKNCGNEWLSRHRDALALSDQHDVNRARRHGKKKIAVGA